MELFHTQKPTRYVVHIGLFALTLMSTTLAGAEWSCNVSLFSTNRPMNWSHIWQGLHFSIPFLLVLTVHEFGHYIVARVHRISVTLPYYMPLWLGFLGIPSMGTAGAFIRIHSRIRDRSQYFDIGVAGPIAGFVAAVAVLWYGFATLPPHTHIFTIHPEYIPYGMDYASHVYEDTRPYMRFGPSLLFDFAQDIIATPDRVPHPYEMIHYPYLLAGYLSLFFTSLNLLPIGQLDGGHLLYGLVNKRWHRHISRIFLLLLLFYAGLGLLHPYLRSAYFMLAAPAYVFFLYLCLRRVVVRPRQRWLSALGIVALQLSVGIFFPQSSGYSGWLLFGFLLGYVLGVAHPGVQATQPMSLTRRLLAYFTIGIFVVCFSWRPFLLN